MLRLKLETPLRLGLNKHNRVHRDLDLSRAIRQGKMVSDRHLRLHMVANGLGRSRMAVLVSVRHGSAVKRNRIKRICREAYRLSRPELPVGYDYILRPQLGYEPVLEELRQSLYKLSRSGEQAAKP